MADFLTDVIVGLKAGDDANREQGDDALVSVLMGGGCAVATACDDLPVAVDVADARRFGNLSRRDLRTQAVHWPMDRSLVKAS